MAKKKQEESGGGGSPAWMATFSDLMNLLLCFFVLLFSMSSVDANKWEQVVASMSSSFSIFSSGSTSIGNGSLVGIGTSQLSNLDEYYTSMGQSSVEKGDDTIDAPSASGQTDGDNSGGQADSTAIGGENQYEQIGGMTPEDIDAGKNDGSLTGGQDSAGDKDGKTLVEQLAALGKAETQEMLDDISELTERVNISDQLEVSMDREGKYVEILLSGSILFDSGSAELKTSCLPLLSKVGDILKVYSKHNIDIIGHTDNVPMKNPNFADNDILSSARAISAAQYLVKEKGLDVTKISWTGRGEYEPIASNATAEGRAQNRRIEIRIYNSYNSD